MDWTTDPKRRSFLDNPDATQRSEFPIQNLPWGTFRRADGRICCGVAIADSILDVTAAEESNLLPDLGAAGHVFAAGSLNLFSSLGRDAWRSVRERLSELLDANEPTLRDRSELREKVIVAQSSVTMTVPFQIGDYTDFYSSREHATNVGTMFRGKDNALQPNWLYLPVGYHGRASSVVASGTPIRRPCGQTRPSPDEPPVFGPSRALDFELEMGAFVGTGNELGRPIDIGDAEQHLFGLAIVNDWSARDIQRWEYVPLGPFLAKNFATSISPWVVTLDALAPFRCDAPDQHPAPLEYLAQSREQATFDIELEVLLANDSLREPFRLTQSNYRHLYWTMAQQVAHHTATGCNLRPGDLLASGTISGPTPDSYGSMLELAWRGERPIDLPDGTTRTMLADGDTCIMRAVARGTHYDVGFGEVSGKVLPARGR